MHHHSFPKHIFILFLLVEQVCKSSLKETSSHLHNAACALTSLSWWTHAQHFDLCDDMFRCR